MIYERRIGQEVFYILPVSSILGKLPVVPVGNTGTIPHGPQPARENDRERFDYRGIIEASRGPSAGPRFKEIDSDLLV